jgi:hypothetical protein
MSQTSNTKVGWALVALLCLALVVQFALLYPKLRVQDAEISALQATLQIRDQNEAEHDTQGQLAAQHQELARLRKDNQELHRLRNEVRQLREANEAVTQTARAGSAVEPTAATAELMGELQRQVQQLQVENAQLRAAEQQALQVQNQGEALSAVCINNLRQLDGAKEQWALENRQPAGTLPEPADLEPYLRDPDVWVCPAGGLYFLDGVGIPPTCSIPQHSLQ